MTTFVAHAVGKAVSPARQVTVVVPAAAQAGDLAVLTVQHNAFDSVTPYAGIFFVSGVSGWTEQSAPHQPNGSLHHVGLWTKVLTAADVGQGTTWKMRDEPTNGADFQADIIVYRGVVNNLIRAISEAPNTATQATVTAPGYTGLRSSHVYVVLGSVDVQSGVTTTAPNLRAVNSNGSGTPGAVWADTLTSATSHPGASFSRSDGGNWDTTVTTFGITLADNQLPSAPGVPTSPAAGEIVRNTTTIAWPAASDPDGDALVYDVDLTRDGGTTWTRILTGTSSTSFAFDWTPHASSPNSRVRVTARDIYNAAGPSAVGPTFAIEHNVAPNSPTLLAPLGNEIVAHSDTQRFRWRFSDPNTIDSQSRYDLRYRVVGAAGWTTVSGNTPNGFHDFAAGTFTTNDYEWQVATYDAAGLVGPYSASGFFKSAVPPPGPVITSPVNNAVIPSASGSVQWSAPAQQAFQVQILDTGNVVQFDTGVVESVSGRSQALSFPVTDVTRKIQVRVRDNSLWSVWTAVTVFISYTRPAVPTTGLTPGTAEITVQARHPAPSGSQPAVIGADIYVRTADASPRQDRHRPFSGVRIRRLLPPGHVFTDPAPASGVDYEYRVDAVGDNGTVSASQWFGAANDALVGGYEHGYETGY